jgi:hypothetical protein
MATLLYAHNMGINELTHEIAYAMCILRINRQEKIFPVRITASRVSHPEPVNFRQFFPFDAAREETLANPTMLTVFPVGKKN